MLGIDVGRFWEYLTGDTLPDGGDAMAYALAAMVDPEEASRRAPGWLGGWIDRNIFQRISGAFSWVMDLLADWFGPEGNEVPMLETIKATLAARSLDPALPDSVESAALSAARDVVTEAYAGSDRFSTPDLSRVGDKAHDDIQPAVEEAVIRAMFREHGMNTDGIPYGDLTEWLAGNEDFQQLRITATEVANVLANAARQAIVTGDETAISEDAISQTIPSLPETNSVMDNLKTRVDELAATFNVIKDNNTLKALDLDQDQIAAVTTQALAGTQAGTQATDANHLTAAELTALHAIGSERVQTAYEALSDENQEHLDNILNNFQDIDIAEYGQDGPYSHTLTFQGANGAAVNLNIAR